MTLKLYNKGLIAAVAMLFCGSAFAVDISRDNYVEWIGASAEGTASSHFVQWKNPISSACDTSSGPRSKISIDDSALFSLLLTAKTANKPVGFYYETTPSSDDITGHEVPCQIVNAWLESE